MKAFDSIKRTRFKLTVYMGGLLFIALFLSIGMRQSDVAAALTIPIGLLLSFYMYGETKNPSLKKDVIAINQNEEIN